MSALLVRRRDRSLVEVTGDDRIRWLDGMVSHDVLGLDPAGPRACRHALLLTPQGRIVADLHVWARPGRLLLDLDTAVVATVLERLERYVIADDVTLRDLGDARAHLGLEGPGAAQVLARAVEDGTPPGEGAVAEVGICGATAEVAGYGLAAPGGRQLLVPGDAADDVARVLAAAGARQATEEEIEVLRVESGTPRMGCELDEEVLPAEARLEDAVSTTKGCYTGQEVVARMRSRGRVAHLLVGLVFDAGPPPADTELTRDGRTIGEVTSSVRSPEHGAIGLGFVRRALAEPGAAVDAGGVPARVVALPFAAARSPAPGDRA